MIRYCLLTRDRDPILWDFGSAVRHHKLYSPWLPQENWRAGFLGFRGAVAPDAGLMRDAVPEIKRSAERRVGKGGVSPCRSRWLTDTLKKKKNRKYSTTITKKHKI